ncbi:MAG: DMT family transporter [Gammaproteobacteria bacterium]
MPTPLIYAIVVLIWGTTWYAIKFQLGVVEPEISLVYRFGLAAVIVFIYARATGRSLRLTARDHRFVAIQGLTLFCLNYWLTYLSTQYLTSGLVAVIFTAIIFLNLVNARIFFGTPVEPRVLVAAGAGMLGVALLFLPELESAMGDRTVAKGALLALSGTWLASLGNMAATRNTKAGLSVVTANAYGLAYGTVGLAIIALLRGAPIAFEQTWSYVISLLYLSLAGTSLAFGLYLLLMKRIGPARAAYTSVLFPVVALAVSTAFEGYRWSLPAIIGLAVLIAGNALALGGRAEKTAAGVSSLSSK